MSDKTDWAAKNSSSANPSREDIPKVQRNEVFSFLTTIISLIALALLLRVSVIEPYKIPSGSMIPTLQIGDYILVSKLSYGIRIPTSFRMPQGFELPWEDGFLWEYSAPKRGDVVVFTRPDDPETPEDESRTNLIKRVIGLASDTIQVQGTTVFINGQALSEPYARWNRGGNPDGNFGPAQVPPHRILLLGDNRDNSKDSRFWNDPFVDIGRVKGRAQIIYWSMDSLKRIGTVIR